MASLEKAFSNDLFDNILPSYGNPGLNIPAWNEEQKMFICDEFESSNGNHYYKGVRFSDRITVIEKIGFYHNWTYIDGIEVYAFDGNKLKLIQLRKYQKQMRSEDFVRDETEAMLSGFLKGVLRLQGESISEELIEEKAKSLTDGCYKSYLDGDYNTRLLQILTQIK